MLITVKSVVCDLITWSHTQLHHEASQHFKIELLANQSSLLYFVQVSLIRMEWLHDWILLELTFNLITQNIWSSQAVNSFFFFQFLQQLPLWIMHFHLTWSSACSSFTPNLFRGLSQDLLPASSNLSILLLIYSLSILGTSRSSQSGLSDFISKTSKHALSLWCTRSWSWHPGHSQDKLNILMHLIPFLSPPHFSLSASIPVFVN